MHFYELHFYVFLINLVPEKKNNYCEVIDALRFSILFVAHCYIVLNHCWNKHHCLSYTDRQCWIMKYILVTGGVISGIGKGIIASSVGTILKSCGLHVTAIKIDPYINIDAGTFSPYEHGKCRLLVKRFTSLEFFCWQYGNMYCNMRCLLWNIG